MSTCSDCNWFGTRESYCSKHHYKVSANTDACSDIWLIVRPMPPIEEDTSDFNICADCLEKGDSLFGAFKFCPCCGKELKR